MCFISLALTHIYTIFLNKYMLLVFWQTAQLQVLRLKQRTDSSLDSAVRVQKVTLNPNQTRQQNRSMVCLTDWSSKPVCVCVCVCVPSNAYGSWWTISASTSRNSRNIYIYIYIYMYTCIYIYIYIYSLGVITQPHPSMHNHHAHILICFP